MRYSMRLKMQLQQKLRTFVTMTETNKSDFDEQMTQFNPLVFGSDHFPWLWFLLVLFLLSFSDFVMCILTAIKERVTVAAARLCEDVWNMSESHSTVTAQEWCVYPLREENKPEVKPISCLQRFCCCRRMKNYSCMDLRKSKPWCLSLIFWELGAVTQKMPDLSKAMLRVSSCVVTTGAVSLAATCSSLGCIPPRTPRLVAVLLQAQGFPRSGERAVRDDTGRVSQNTSCLSWSTSITSARESVGEESRNMREWLRSETQVEGWRRKKRKKMYLIII